ncbi:MAG: formylglycine-generating enzyme family protein [Sediminicola sp.]|tara:strand:- start:71250 stop:72245 length:996 start_codon:yes stop_codon:yes gene_type:complete
MNSTIEMPIWAFLLPLLLITGTNNAQNGNFGDYTQKIAGSDLEFEMVALSGGQFQMGSPVTEVDRKEDEGPLNTVAISPFWIGKYEVTWEQYLLFLNRETDTVDSSEKGDEVSVEVDAISGATVPYVDMSLGMGKGELPVVNVTQLAASKFCEWLSAKTGYFYRLPTEAEWEYACRAGSGSAYSFGDEVGDLADYGWFYDNSDGAYKKGGQKKPNSWGLYDMHGNVAEWTLDQYVPDTYSQREGTSSSDPLVRTIKRYPTVVRGGSWDDDADRLRSAARQPSSDNWNRRDPQLPKSVWWNTDAAFVGFRIVRAKKPPKDGEDATFRISENP